MSELLELKLPALAESVVEGEVLGWLVEEGQTIRDGQPVLEIMTDKVTVELPSPFSGVLKRRLVNAGDVVPVGAILALVEGAGAVAVTTSPQTPLPPEQRQEAAENLREERSIIESGAQVEVDPGQVAAVFQRRRETAPATPPQSPARERPVLAVPSARRLAREQRIDLADMTGSGPNGVIRHADVLAHIGRPAETVPAPPPPASPAGRERRVPFKGQRRAISQGLMSSLANTALTHTIEELDCTELTALRDELRPDASAAGVKLSYMPFFFKAVALALQDYPSLNSRLDTSTQEIVFRDDVNLGMAVNTEGGLIVPVVRDVTGKNLLNLAREVTELTSRALEGRLAPDDLRDATFTVSNIGAVGALVGFPIVTPPAVGILSLHGITRRPVALMQGDEEVMAIRPMMYLTLGFDHRLVDGVDAVRFTKRVVELLESPKKLMLRL